jgi:HEAT repeat protein
MMIKHLVTPTSSLKGVIAIPIRGRCRKPLGSSLVEKPMKNIDDRIDALIEALGQKKNWAMLERASKELIEIGLPTVAKLTDSMLDANSGINDAAGVILAEISPPGITQVLVKACKDESWQVRKAAAFSLGVVGDKATLPTILEMLESDEHAYVRQSAAVALGRIGDAVAIPGLINALRNRKNNLIYPFAGVALSKIGEPALPSLLDALCDDTIADHEAVENALVSLGALAVPRLLSLFHRNDMKWYVLPRAASILGRIGHPAAIPSLRNALYKGDNELCSSAAWALSVIQDPRVIDVLVEALMRDDPMTRGTVAGAITPMQDDRIVNALSALLSDNRLVWENPHMKPVKVKEMAAQALEAIGTTGFGRLKEG